MSEEQNPSDDFSIVDHGLLTVLSYYPEGITREHWMRQYKQLAAEWIAQLAASLTEEFQPDLEGYDE